MAMTEQQFIELEGNINQVWDAYHKHKKDYISDFFNVIKKNQSQFTDYTVGAMGTMDEWDGSVSYDSFEKGYEKQYRASKYSKGLQIDRDLYDDKEYEQIKSRVNAVAYAVHKTMIRESAYIFNNATSSVITGPDGQPLGSASHKTTPGAAVQSNLGTNELTYAGLETSMLALESLTDDRGDKMLIYGDMVIAGPNQRDNCKKLFGTDKEAYVGDNTKNVYADMTYMIHPLITGDRWFLVSKDIMKGGSGLNFFMRRDPNTLERDGSTATGDFNTEKLSWKAVGRWSKGWTNFYFAYVNNV